MEKMKLFPQSLHSNFVFLMLKLSSTKLQCLKSVQAAGLGLNIRSYLEVLDGNDLHLQPLVTKLKKCGEANFCGPEDRFRQWR